MPAISLAGVDSAGGGIILNTLQISSRLNGSPIAVAGDVVMTHGSPPNVHIGAVMVASHSSTIGGHQIVTEGDVATCGHTVSGSASSTLD